MPGNGCLQSLWMDGHDYVPWREMQDIHESGNRIASSLANFRLLDQGIVEYGCGVLLLLRHITTGILAFCLFPCRDARDIESHLHQLILPSTGLLALSTSTAKVPICASVGTVDREGHFDGNLIPTRQIGVANL
jgi:hypothetical protein